MMTEQPVTYELIDYAGNTMRTTSAADVIHWVTKVWGTARVVGGNKISYKGIVDSFEDIYCLDDGVYYIIEEGTYYLHDTVQEFACA